MSVQVDVRRLLESLGMQATKDGDEWRAKCPSGRHEDRHPSWTIKEIPGSKKHGSHYCFGCKFGGGPAELVMASIGVTFSSAMRWVEEHAMRPEVALSVSIQIKPFRRPRFVLPVGVMVIPIEEWVTPARRYVEQRGITREQATRWGLGYAVEGRLGGRIVFPVFDAWGRLVSYSARTYVDAPKRYIMPNENPLKGPVEGSDPGAIWGEHRWPEPARRDAIVVLEGIINGLAVERVSTVPLGVLLGSKIQLTHIHGKLDTFKRVVVLTDPDYAGDNAAHELQDVLRRYVDVRRVRLRKGTDAASIPEEELRCMLSSHLA